MSPIRVLAVAALAEALLFANPILAQSPPTPNPLDTVPDKMPFDVPYGAPISLERAQAVIGCSGGTGSQDEVSCKAGAAIIK